MSICKTQWCSRYAPPLSCSFSLARCLECLSPEPTQSSALSLELDLLRLVWTELTGTKWSRSLPHGLSLQSQLDCYLVSPSTQLWCLLAIPRPWASPWGFFFNSSWLLCAFWQLDILWTPYFKEKAAKKILWKPWLFHLFSVSFVIESFCWSDSHKIQASRNLIG